MTQHLDTKQVSRICSNACRAYPDISRGWLFGSFARGDYTQNSDIDLRLEFRKNSKFNLFDLAHLGDAIESATGRECDIITIRKITSPELENNYLKDRVLIYERNEK